MEWLWAALLIVGFVGDRRGRPLAVLLALKWGLNYAAAFNGMWLVPPLVDLSLGALGVYLALRLPDWRSAFLPSCFVVAPIIHAWHWVLWDAGVYVGVQYHALMLGLFTAQVVALSWPGVRNLVYRGFRWLVFARRGSVAGLAAERRQGRGSEG